MSDLDHAALFEDHLVDGEKIRWTGRPDPSVNFDRRDLALVPFSIAEFPGRGVRPIPHGNPR